MDQERRDPRTNNDTTRSEPSFNTTHYGETDDQMSDYDGPRTNAHRAKPADGEGSIFSPRFNPDSIDLLASMSDEEKNKMLHDSSEDHRAELFRHFFEEDAMYHQSLQQMPTEVEEAATQFAQGGTVSTTSSETSEPRTPDDPTAPEVVHSLELHETTSAKDPISVDPNVVLASAASMKSSTPQPHSNEPKPTLYNRTPIKHVVVLGGGLIGTSLACHLVKHHDVDVLLVETNAARLRDLRESRHRGGLKFMPERGKIREILSDHYLDPLSVVSSSNEVVERKSHFLALTSDATCVAYAQIVFVCVGSVDVPTALSTILKAKLERSTIIVIHSTLQSAVSKKVAEIADEGHLLALVPLFCHGDRILRSMAQQDLHIYIGTRKNFDSGALTSLIFFYRRHYHSQSIHPVGWETAEYMKLIRNALRAHIISTVNEIATICKRNGASFYEVKRACVDDQGLHMRGVKPSAGFGGPGLIGAVRDLKSRCVEQDISSPLLSNVEASNRAQIERIARQIMTLVTDGACVAFLGMTFKYRVATMCESPTLQLIKVLYGLGYNLKVHLHDPGISVELAQQATVAEGIHKTCSCSADRAHSPVMGRGDALKGAALAVVMNGCVSSPHLLTTSMGIRQQGWLSLRNLMCRAVILDTQDFLNRSALQQLGYEVHKISDT